LLSFLRDLSQHDFIVCYFNYFYAINVFSDGMTEVDVKLIFSSYPTLPTKPLLLAVKRGNVATLAADMKDFKVQEIARKFFF